MHPVMIQHFLATKQVAARIGVKPATLSRYKLPEPDAVIGEGQRAVKGWLPETIDAWNLARPGRGNWGEPEEARNHA
ncbi:hypothetical protein HMPREF0578_0227 [Mobiluncus mulieris 28-1]|uniref:Uncharacterized protein n=2 Tax=Mobiluncus mulieris TaxID=2052 RepID=E0QR86_9ACTO|nr:hypothetical protein [Mobiluncus mulieris]EEZ90321.1 hypothetical protein HMPREF0578_0227 [Mobiluncus mulieris 28-1]EFM46079.1 hypothetical protein HMPREF0580_1401 [Mobiluncus mulieris ATCC 35239]MCU9970117.1 transcriptional regulator [Mobiluncus mulieris]MCU9974575.1 transcriptional regulator [Mobiluncus mulieris]MCU9993434.1 transcriptional regulator [Mobiluncus mulieris]